MDNHTTVQVPVVPAIAEAQGRARNVVDPTSLELIARANAILVSLRDIDFASTAIHRLAVVDRHREGRINCLLGLSYGNRDKASVLNARLEALARLVRAGQMPYGVLPAAADGFRMISDTVFLAAAKVPLLFIDREPYFEPAAFVAFVLEHATVYGHA